MTDEIQGAGSPNIDAGSKDGEAGKTGDQKEQFVKYESFDTVVKQHKSSKAESERLAAEVKVLKQAEQKRQEEELAAQGNWQKIVETREQEIKELRAKVEAEADEKNKAYGTLVDARKLQAVCDKLPGKIVDPEYLSFIDLREVAFNPDTQEIDESSVQAVANAFMERHQRLVDTSHVGRLPADHARSSRPAHEGYNELPLKEMRENLPDAVRAAKKARGII